MIARLGKEIDNPDSVYYWAYKVTFLTLVLSNNIDCTNGVFGVSLSEPETRIFWSVSIYGMYVLPTGGRLMLKWRLC